MDLVSLLLCAALLVTTLLLIKNRSSSRFAELINKIPGPYSYPILGTVVPFLFLKRNGMCPNSMHDYLTSIVSRNLIDNYFGSHIGTWKKLTGLPRSVMSRHHKKCNIVSLKIKIILTV